MAMSLKTRGFMETIEALVNNRITDQEAESMLLDCGYSADLESAKRTVILIYNEISNFRMNKDSIKLDSQERDYKKEYRTYHGKPEQKKNRAARNKARNMMGLKVGDPREVDHKNPLSKGGSNKKKNLRIVSRSTNRKKGDK